METLESSSKASLDQVNKEIVTIETELEKLYKIRDTTPQEMSPLQLQKEIKRLTDDLSYKKEQSKMIETHVCDFDEGKELI